MKYKKLSALILSSILLCSCVNTNISTNTSISDNISSEITDNYSEEKIESTTDITESTTEMTTTIKEAQPTFNSSDIMRVNNDVKYLDVQIIDDSPYYNPVNYSPLTYHINRIKVDNEYIDLNNAITELIDEESFPLIELYNKDVVRLQNGELQDTYYCDYCFYTNVYMATSKYFSFLATKGYVNTDTPYDECYNYNAYTFNTQTGKQILLNDIIICDGNQLYNLVLENCHTDYLKSLAEQYKDMIVTKQIPFTLSYNGINIMLKYFEVPILVTENESIFNIEYFIDNLPQYYIVCPIRKNGELFWDIFQDGIMDIFTINIDKDNNCYLFTINGTTTVIHPEDVYLDNNEYFFDLFHAKSFSIIHAPSGYYIFINGSGGDESACVYCFKINSDYSITFTDYTSDDIEIVNPEHFIISHWSNIGGVCNCYNEYIIDENGKFTCDEYYERKGQMLILKKDTLVIKKDTNETIELTIGTNVDFIGYDSEFLYAKIVDNDGNVIDSDTYLFTHEDKIIHTEYGDEYKSYINDEDQFDLFDNIICGG